MNKCIERNYLTMKDCSVDLAKELDGEKYGSELSLLLEDRFCDNWIIFVDGKVEDDKVEEKKDRWLRRFRFVYESTKDRYNALLNLYKASEGKLMDKLSTKSVSRFNDTPQDGGDWSDDNHTSNITQSSTEADMEDVMSRLARIQQNYRDLLSDWVDEFRRLFGEEI